MSGRSGKDVSPMGSNRDGNAPYYMNPHVLKEKNQQSSSKKLAKIVDNNHNTSA
eukprot:CAMPEP_0114601844 /NCGR_PEP_ID=MMETSP0125-20121206/24464_1 /TAXON_ID=485358 ORGANISM="Aristerostoma sp., Strain ATCC 50986" /NCGR_SAMPLE_ID=MMETSP0125 /ASSEMBLY_ACC=CAM_ASM_000245 /LENGTH=53 /DNA_ID=CAMNT_0001811481 /DNA_START=541 /DNA_END=702 /DNA_ORIENTATION=-